MATTGMESNEMSEEPDTYDATELDEGKWGALRMIGLLALLAAFAGFVYLAYMQGVRNGAVGAPPVITAEAGPYKVAPKSPGGQTFANQDKMIFDRVEGTPPGGVDVSSGPAVKSPAVQSATGDDIVSHPAPPLVIADSTTTQSSAQPSDDSSDGIAAAIEKADAQTPTAPPPKPAETPAPTITVAKVEQPAQAAPVTSPVAAASGAYLVQIASYRDMPSAQDAWTKFSSKFGVLAGKVVPDYQTAEIPGKGTYYRLRVGPFDTKESAAGLCDALKAQGQGCFVVKS